MVPVKNLDTLTDSFEWVSVSTLLTGTMCMNFVMNCTLTLTSVVIAFYKAECEKFDHTTHVVAEQRAAEVSGLMQTAWHRPVSWRGQQRGCRRCSGCCCPGQSSHWGSTLTPSKIPALRRWCCGKEGGVKCTVSLSPANKCIFFAQVGHYYFDFIMQFYMKLAFANLILQTLNQHFT